MRKFDYRKHNKNSENGKGRQLSSVALSEAKSFFEALMAKEWKGRGDQENLARWRVSRKTGVPDSYLKRLQYKISEMNDVKGEAYRLLKLSYEAECLKHENAADQYEAQRLDLINETTQSANKAGD